MYMEDVDLCWRLRRLGWRVAYEPAGRVTHVQGGQHRAAPYRMIVEHHRSVWLFTRTRATGMRRIALPALGLGIAARGALAIEHRWSQGIVGPSGSGGRARFLGVRARPLA